MRKRRIVCAPAGRALDRAEGTSGSSASASLRHAQEATPAATLHAASMAAGVLRACWQNHAKQVLRERRCAPLGDTHQDDDLRIVEDYA